MVAVISPLGASTQSAKDASSFISIVDTEARSKLRF
jgi:hypothetical protein